jgi:hypothetical protein
MPDQLIHKARPDGLWRRRDLFDLLMTWVALTELEDKVDFRRSSLVLRRYGIECLGDLVATSRAELLQIKELEAGTVDVIEQVLRDRNLHLDEPCHEWLAYKALCLAEGRSADFTGPQWDEVVAYPPRRASGEGLPDPAASRPRNSRHRSEKASIPAHR